ncbi:fatty acid synthase beta subunit fas1 [Batrachochytrium dendrobatidis]|nr:fatty acid synthase beta subunit fas1 [Batrachochytrium dendrobatidis]
MHSLNIFLTIMLLPWSFAVVPLTFEPTLLSLINVQAAPYHLAKRKHQESYSELQYSHKSTKTQLPSYDFISTTMMQFPKLVNFLDGTTNVTVFLPSDQAFLNLEKQFPSYYNSILEKNSTMFKFLQYHVLGYSYDVNLQEASRTFQTTYSNEPLMISIDSDHNINVGSGIERVARVTHTQYATNGIINFIDDVLVPPRKFEFVVRSRPDLSSFYKFVLSSPGMLSALNALKGTTIFAPTNKAFQKLNATESNKDIYNHVGVVSSIIDYHIIKPMVSSLIFATFSAKGNSVATGLPGENMTITFNGSYGVVHGASECNEAELIQTDIILDGGNMLHLIDTVLLPSVNAMNYAKKNNYTLRPSF